MAVFPATTPNPLTSQAHISHNAIFSDSRMLKGGWINGSSHLFHLLLLSNLRMQTAASRCTVFPFYIMHYVQDGSSADIIWRNTKINIYWQTNIWVIPIHDLDLEHWVVATIYIDEGCILFFDSLSTCASLQTRLKVCSLPQAHIIFTHRS